MQMALYGFCGDVFGLWFGLGKAYLGKGACGSPLVGLLSDESAALGHLVNGNAGKKVVGGISTYTGIDFFPSGLGVIPALVAEAEDCFLFTGQYALKDTGCEIHGDRGRAQADTISRICHGCGFWVVEQAITCIGLAGVPNRFCACHHGCNGQARDSVGSGQ